MKFCWVKRDYQFEISNTWSGPTETAQQLRAFAAFSQDPDSLSSTHIRKLTSTYNSSFRGFDTPLDSKGIYTLVIHIHICRHTHTHTIKIDKSFNKEMHAQYRNINVNLVKGGVWNSDVDLDFVFFKCASSRKKNLNYDHVTKKTRQNKTK